MVYMPICNRTITVDQALPKNRKKEGGIVSDGNLSVNLVPSANLNYQNAKCAILNVTDHATVAYTVSPQFTKGAF